MFKFNVIFFGTNHKLIGFNCFSGNIIGFVTCEIKDSNLTQPALKVINDGTKMWYQYNPAVEYFDGTKKMWYQNNKLSIQMDCCGI